MTTLDAVATKLDQISARLDAGDDKRLAAFESLLLSIETTLADLLGNVERGGGAAAIEAMAKALGELRIPAAPPVTVPPIEVPPATVTVNVPPQVAPVVNNRIEPTPITVEALIPPAPAPVIHVMPAPEQKGAKWKVTIPGQYGAPDRVMTIERTN